MKTPETPFLLDFFKTLNERDVQYAVLRPNVALPESLDGSDLDLLASNQKDALEIADIADKVAATYSGSKTVCYDAGAIVICFAGRNVDGWWGCHIDIFIGLTYCGVQYMPISDLFVERTLVKDSYYTLGFLSDFSSFLKEILHTGKTRKDYYPMARAVYAEKKDTILPSLRKCYTASGVSMIQAMMEREYNAEELRKSATKLRRCLHCRNYSAKFKIILKRVGRMFNPPGYSIAFLGTDGSGKSTIIASITPVLGRMLHAKVVYEHLRPNWLPSLARLSGSPPMDGPVTNPHAGKTAGRVSSLVRFFYYYIDYTVGFWRKIYPILVKRPSMVFFDRYYYEYMIDPKRCAVRLPKGFAKFFSWFIPKPKLILCLVGDPEKIYARKPETSIEEVRRQVGALKDFCMRNHRAVLIDTTQTLEATIDQTLDAITKAMARRYR